MNYSIPKACEATGVGPTALRRWVSRWRREQEGMSQPPRLQDQELVFRAFWQCLIDKDIESFKEILRGHLDAVNKGSLAKRSKTSRRTLHRILSPEGNPTLKSISNVIHALYG